MIAAKVTGGYHYNTVKASKINLCFVLKSSFNIISSLSSFLLSHRIELCMYSVCYIVNN